MSEYCYLFERLLGELRKLSGWGATPHRLPSLPTLRQVLGVPADMRFTAAGLMMQRALLKAIRELEDTNHKLALQVLLRYDRSVESAVDRRTWVINHLGAACTVDHWRHGPEAELISVLAEHLINRLDMPLAA